MRNETIPKIKASLPAGLQEVIKTVLKTSSYIITSISTYTTEDDIFIPSLSEVLDSGSPDFERFKANVKSDGDRYGSFKIFGDTKKDMFNVKTVKKGENGNHVLLVQEILRARGFKGKDGKELALDKDCGTNTVYAIKQYQKAREKADPGICGSVDGIAGPKTLQDMIAL